MPDVRDQQRATREAVEAELQALASLPVDELNAMMLAVGQGLLQSVRDLLADPAAQAELLLRAHRFRQLCTAQVVQARRWLEAAHATLVGAQPTIELPRKQR